MPHRLFEEIEKFRAWSRQLDPLPEEARPGQWEGGYDQWDAIDSAFVNFISTSEPANWTGEMGKALLYIIARDNHSEVFADLVAAQPDKLRFLARQAVDAQSPASKWQLAVRLPEFGDQALAESLLLRFINDPNEYVRRRALLTLAEIRSCHTEHYCEVAWSCPGPHQPYQRMAVLEAFFKINSPKLHHYLAEARQDGNPELVRYAEEIEKKVSTL